MWGRYRSGRWFPARVAEVLGDGRYVLDWDDGDPQDRVKGPDEVSLERCLHPCLELGLVTACKFDLSSDLAAYIHDQSLARVAAVTVTTATAAAAAKCSLLAVTTATALI